MSDEVLGQIVGAIQAARPKHDCRFDDADAKRMHALSDTLAGEGMENFRAVLEFGGKLRMLSKFGWITFVTVVVGALISALWMGIKAQLQK